MSLGGVAAERGFTLIEVLVALGIVAIALLAGSQATSALTRNAQRQTSVLLAQLCAENELVRSRLVQQFPPVAQTRFTCVQADVSFEVTVTVAPTPNPNFRRIDVQVADGAAPVLRISTVIGR